MTGGGAGFPSAGNYSLLADPRVLHGWGVGSSHDGFFAVYVVCFCCVIFLFRPLYPMFTYSVTFPEGHLQCNVY